VRQEELAKTLEETKVRLAQERTEYEARNADLEKAISSLENAIAALDNAKPSFLQVDFKKSLKHMFDMAEVMDLVKSPKQKKVVAFLQGSSKVDPNDPEYKYHSQGILDLLNDLLGDFNAEKRDVDAEWEKTRTSEEDLIADTESQMDENKISIETLEGDVETLGTEIAQAREDLVDAESLLKDDQQYLKDLTERCEQRAHAYDQRSSMRGSELTALTKALDILQNKVLNKDEAANERALLQTPKDAPKDTKKPVSFLQQAQTARAKMTNLLQKSRESSDGEDRKTKALAMIATAGSKLQSTILMSLAMKAKADPFLKVKELIQKLIERLISEATAEATKKGFCDLELSKAEKNRNHRFADVKRLSAELASLNAKKDALEEELEELATSLKELNAALEEATKLRADSKAENMQTLKDAKAGLSATSEALLILKVFYKQSAKAKVLLQASPIEEDDTGAESGAYKGNQDSAKAILGLLEVIVSDFQRTVSNTQAQEDQEQAEFIKFDRTSKADIGGKETKTELDEQDLAATETSITEKMKDLQTNQDLVDKALEELEELKPMCIDTGMSYEERVEKREEEIEALKGALCQLDPENAEPTCQNR